MQSSSQDIPPPVQSVTSPHPALGIYEPTLGPVSPLPPLRQDYDEHLAPAMANMDVSSNVAQHPNGSEGWLPVEDPGHVPATAPSSHLHAQNTNNLKPSPLASPALNTAHAQQGQYNWAAAPDTETSVHNRRATTGGSGTHSPIATSPSMTNGVAAETGGAALGRASSRRSVHTTSDGRQIQGSAFVNGAGTTGPFATAHDDDDLLARAQDAQANLTPKQREKIARTEAKNGKKLSRIIKEEAKTEKKSLAIAIEELAGLQRMQKNAIKSESRVQANHSKLLTTFKKTEAAYLSAKLKYETALGELNAEAAALEVLKNNSREATEKVQDKATEVDALRKTLAVDEREREVRLAELSGRSGSLKKGNTVRESRGGRHGGEMQREPARRSFFGGHN